jgi:thiamine phosphate synthase YjbQ (UPF0047 family)
MWYQHTIVLHAKPRGFHLVTDEIIEKLPQLASVNVGILHLLLQHTSASLTLNETVIPLSVTIWNVILCVRYPKMLPTSMTMKALMICLRTSSHRCLARR